MDTMRVFLVPAIFLFFPVLASAASGVTINEVMFDPQGTDTGLEWVEIFNGGNEAADLSGWELYPDGIGYFTFPVGFSIMPKEFVVVYLRTSGSASAHTQYHSSATGNMGNTSGSVALFSDEPRGKETIKSFVAWGRGGETWEGAAADAGLWTKGNAIDVSSLTEGNSIALAADGEIAGSAAAWMIAVTPTAGVFNKKVALLSSPSNLQTASSSAPDTFVAAPAPPPAPSYFFPEIHVFAGEDRVSAAGSRVEFLGQSTGEKKEPLENAHYWWNFGDGDAAEGRAVSHLFAFPGVYTVGLHVTSGIFAASDYLSVQVVPNQLSVRDVIGGEAGFFTLRNHGKEEVDIGGWIVRDTDGKQFTIPWRTKIAAASEASFPNRITGLSQGLHTTSLILSYPNGVLALEWKMDEPVIGPAQAEKNISEKENHATAVFPASFPIATHASNSDAALREAASSSGATGASTSSAMPAALGFSHPSILFFAGAILFSVAGAVIFLFLKVF